VSIDARLSRLSSALSARERAILVLGSLKDKTPEDPAWRHTMPRDQVHEFNRLIGLMNVANRELSLIIGHLAQSTREMGVREAWLVSLVLWQEHIDEIRRAIRLTVREPITESQHGALVEATRAEYVPVDELAAMLAGEHQAGKTATSASAKTESKGLRTRHGTGSVTRRRPICAVTLPTAACQPRVRAGVSGSRWARSTTCSGTNPGCYQRTI
jgi:hypothetical protein